MSKYIFVHYESFFKKNMEMIRFTNFKLFKDFNQIFIFFKKFKVISSLHKQTSTHLNYYFNIFKMLILTL